MNVEATEIIEATDGGDSLMDLILAASTQAEEKATEEATVEATRNTALSDPDDDGYQWEYDVDTGEVLGIHGKPAPTIANEEDANWALHRLGCIEAKLAARQARLEALTSNMNALIKAERNKQARWEYLYRGLLITWAKTQLKGKAKTVQLEAGKIAFRKTNGRAEIIDTPGAIEFVRDYLPEAIKTTEKLTVSDALKALRLAEIATGETIKPSWLLTTPGEDSITITTGIKEKD